MYLKALTRGSTALLAALTFASAAFAQDDCNDDGCKAASGLKGLQRIYGTGGMLEDCYANDCNGIDDLPGIDKSDPLENPASQSEPEAAPEPDTYTPDCYTSQPC